MNHEPIHYGKIIKYLRKKSKMTQQELSEKISVGKTSIANYESGYSIPPVQILENIAEIFGMSLTQLLLTNPDNNSSGISDNILLIPDPKYDQNTCTMVIRYIRPENISVSTLDAERYNNSCIYVPGNLFNDKNASYFFTKMTDNSMEADGIRKNDYVFVRKTDEITNNSIVFAIDTVTNQYYIRKYMRDNHILTLIPASYSVEYPILREDCRETNIKIVGCIEKGLISFSGM